MATLVLDIETAGFIMDAFDQVQKEYLTQFATDADELIAVEERLSYYPLTAETVAIGVYIPETSRLSVLYRSRGGESQETVGEITLYPYKDERTLLRAFWEGVQRNLQGVDRLNRIVTFNGRGFDAPFLVLRSAIQRVAVPPWFVKTALGYRYQSSHVDLADQLTFFGLVRRKFPLDFYCKAFGIESPKSGGITGKDVPELFRQGKGREIALYCALDLKATHKLYLAWNEFINPDRQIAVE